MGREERFTQQDNALEPIFRAGSVAVIGASATPGKTGNTILRNIIDAGYHGRIFPVNPKGGEILGLQAYPSLTDVPGQVDLGVFVVPAEAVPGLLLAGRQVGMRGAVIISGGFGEVGNNALDAELLSNAATAGIRVIGPNCQGINYTPAGLCATWPLVRAKGPIAVISQSGTVGAALSGWAEDEGLGISGFVGLGNKADVSELELLEFFGSDPETKAIALYLERVRDGERFRDIARRVSGQKRIIALKGGRTSEGRRAAQSHTRSVAGRYEVFTAVCRDAGVTPVRDVESLYDSAKAAALMQPPVGKRVMILTSSGGSGILAADAIVDHGLSLARLTPEARQELAAALPSRCVIADPLDLTGDATADRYQLAAGIAAKYDLADIYLFIFGDPIPGAGDAVLATMAQTGRPAAVIYIGGGDVQKQETVVMQQQGIPVFPTPERAIRALAAMVAD